MQKLFKELSVSSHLFILYFNSRVHVFIACTKNNQKDWENIAISKIIQKYFLTDAFIVVTILFWYLSVYFSQHVQKPVIFMNEKTEKKRIFWFYIINVDNINLVLLLL